MLVLSIETATDAVGVAVGRDDEVMTEATVMGRRLHAETLAPMIEEALERVDIDLQELEGIAVDNGPGLFSGLRVGVATANGLAMALDLGVVSFSSLEILARAAGSVKRTGYIVPVVDGRRGELFCAVFQPRPPGTAGSVDQLVPPRRCRPAELVDDLASLGDDVTVVGDGTLRYGELLASVPGVVLGGPDLAYPPPATLARHAMWCLEGSHNEEQRAAEPLAVVRYMREADVRIRWERRPWSPSRDESLR